jgi:predicted nucleic acid-binding Zn ribbon protein
MALLIRGTTTCPICGKVIEEGEDASLFPHFVLNEKDELYQFSDGAFHSACLEHHPLRNALAATYKAYRAQTGPGHRRCAVCGMEIDNPDEYFGMAYLADPSRDELGDFNFTHLHKSHIGRWREKGRFLALARQAIAAGRWKGEILSKLVQEVEAER